ncbi:MAG: DUF2178 domain-containing protein [Bacteroidales bacterium]|nr:DUF2178 domain-containing protein [Bacteroidales bacterium]
MKKSYSFLIVNALVLVMAIIWLMNSGVTITFQGVVPWTILLMILALGFYIGLSQLVRSKKKGEPPEDELSKKILQKASSLSFYVSIYLWLALMYLSDRLELETPALIGAGILGMTVVFAVCWIIYKLGGIKDA